MRKTMTKTFVLDVTVNLEHAQGDEFEMVRDDLMDAMAKFDHAPEFVSYDLRHLDLRIFK